MLPLSISLSISELMDEPLSSLFVKHSGARDPVTHCRGSGMRGTTCARLHERHSVASVGASPSLGSDVSPVASAMVSKRGETDSVGNNDCNEWRSETADTYFKGE